MSKKAKRLFWVVMGHCFLVMGIIGPIPFIFLASACYRKGSARFHSLLRNNRFIGIAIANWEDRRTVTLHAKLIALCSLAISATSLFIFFSSPWLVAGIVVVALGIALFILTRTTAT